MERAAPMSPRSTRAVYILTAVAVAVIIGALTLLVCWSPRAPAEWRAIRPGMKREEVLRIVRDPARDLRKSYGCDIFARQCRMMMVRSRVWWMNVSYDDRDEVVKVDIWHDDDGWGPFRRHGMSNWR